MTFLCEAAITFLVMVIAVDEIDAGKYCSSNADCSDSQVCYYGNCFGECRTDSQCSYGKKCYRAFCKESCNGNADCPSNVPVCRSNGYCYPQRCRTVALAERVAKRDCGSGWVCVAGYCYRRKSCNSNDDCPSYWPACINGHCFLSCSGVPTTDYSCCTSSNPCNVGKGDCDSDYECAGSLVCGTNNCKSDFSSSETNWTSLADCCIGQWNRKTVSTYYHPSNHWTKHTNQQIGHKRSINPSKIIAELYAIRN